MSGLAESQRRFLGNVYGEAPVGDRIAVYRGNMLANLHDALAAAYPVVRRLVGEGFFRETAARFARAHPSMSGDLHAFGAELAEFLAGYAPARSLGYLPDVARLEWAVATAFHAREARTLDLAALAAIGEEDRGRVRFFLQAGARLIASDHPIVAIWEANQPGCDGTPETNQAGEGALVYREALAVRVCAPEPAAWRLLLKVAEGARLESMADDPVLAGRLAEVLPQWTRCGVIDAFALSPQR